MTLHRSSRGQQAQAQARTSRVATEKNSFAYVDDGRHQLKGLGSVNAVHTRPQPTCLRQGQPLEVLALSAAVVSVRTCVFGPTKLRLFRRPIVRPSRTMCSHLCSFTLSFPFDPPQSPHHQPSKQSRCASLDHPSPGELSMSSFVTIGHSMGLINVDS